MHPFRDARVLLYAQGSLFIIEIEIAVFDGTRIGHIIVTVEIAIIRKPTFGNDVTVLFVHPIILDHDSNPLSFFRPFGQVYNSILSGILQDTKLDV